MHDLSDDDKMHIIDIFLNDVVPRLRKFHARIGTINCDFAGDLYQNWTIRFKSAGSDFEIVDFEYDEDSCSFDLGL